MSKRRRGHVVLLATGGTIASRARSEFDGAKVAADGAQALADGVSHEALPPVRVQDVLRSGSYALSFDDMLLISVHIQKALDDPETIGVVVAHGTDTMEESAFLAELVHDDPRPVVFTGAQRAADSDAPDGPRNLADAIAVAAAPDARLRGVLVSFAGEIFPVPGVRKSQTQELEAFSNPDLGPVGHIDAEGVIRFVARHAGRARFPLPVGSSSQRVDLIASYPGADDTHLVASLATGASGIVLQGTGVGNANPLLCAAIADATTQGVLVVTSTRVHAGPVAAVYGAGGGSDLLAAGAIPSGILKPSQSLVLLSLLLRLDRSRAEVVEAFATWGGAP